MNVLVTGASGFVGRRLCKELADQGIAFVGTGRTSREGILGVGDLTPDTDWSEALRNVSDVVHLAARVHVMDETEADPAFAFRRVNVDATASLARQAALAGVKRFVFVSSVKVNGESTTGKPYSESDSPAPEDPYGTSKHLAEVALWELSRETGLEVVVVRPPLVYGPGVKANFQNLMRAVHRGVPLPIGSVRNLRSMIALDNLSDFLVTVLTHVDAAGHTFLVSDGDDISTATLARKLATAMHRRAHLVPVPLSVLRLLGAVTGKKAAIDRVTGSLQVDITQAKTVLGWTPRVSVDQGIEHTVADFLSTWNNGR
ncbi:N-acetyl-alpha-D-glucosaminyl-diphospho-ditrans, octacis-undecaprenol 4-epimerase [Paraburkholderia domus]|uniref:UDP-glucose 4-epimerase family protein n=1 Tax=Paraburkholderia domus TaxID=2793075 RepID=UPI001911786C|nr:SDR family oxidoreductase [Paraburkholderia domus]MBK5052534.1 SDR family oxidoreductase [Burkholderia sp. R-70006]CAE6812034.1 N-acetyl-alpha-D-glucosaminyl-diphospho-ditrans, octacis-undecaprenol 4-epimerase [Paraburkholderia domus]CAE6889149.1 N-acetyl-alpha-D-glucosaminyl-diphospho-ditrans, octacis-undecaprenol 4-epimerase [Paraburkholderia domus]